MVSSLSDHPEATYSFWSLMAIKPVSKWLATYGWDGVDPGYSYQFLEPVGEAKLEDYAKAGWDAEDVQQYLDAYYKNFNAPIMLPYLRITGTQEYYDILDTNLSAAMSGAKTPQQALDDTAAGLGAGHRPPRPRQAAQGLSGSDRLEGLTVTTRPGRRARPGAFLPLTESRSLTDALDEPDPLPVPCCRPSSGCWSSPSCRSVYSLYLAFHNVDQRDGGEPRTEVPRLDEDGKPVLEPDGTPRMKTDRARDGDQVGVRRPRQLRPHLQRPAWSARRSRSPRSSSWSPCRCRCCWAWPWRSCSTARCPADRSCAR